MADLDTIPKLAGAIFVLTDAVGRLVARQKDSDALLEKVSLVLDGLSEQLAKMPSDAAGRAVLVDMIDGAKTTCFDLGSAAGEEEIGQ